LVFQFIILVSIALPEPSKLNSDFVFSTKNVFSTKWMDQGGASIQKINDLFPAKPPLV
jgi:hypothetical protein